MSNSNRGSLLFVLFATCVTAMGGFLFGYDTAVINGANSYIKAHWDLSDFQEGLVGASAILGCIPGAMFAGVLSDRFGRKRMLFLCAILYGLSADPFPSRPDSEPQSIPRCAVYLRAGYRGLVDDLPGLHRRVGAGEMARPPGHALPTGNRRRHLPHAVRQQDDPGTWQRHMEFGPCVSGPAAVAN